MPDGFFRAIRIVNSPVRGEVEWRELRRDRQGNVWLRGRLAGVR
jgi:hypothetical protein